MIREVISGRQGVCLMAMFIIGGTLAIGAVNEAGTDSWLAVAAGIVLALPALLVYARLKRIRPDMDLYDMARWTMGRVLGRVLIILYAWYALHMGALVLRSFTEFISIETLTETPQAVVAVLMGFIGIWAVKSGPETLGRWSSVFLIAVISIFLLTIFAGIPKYDLNNALPIAKEGIGPVVDGSTSAFAFPFAETVVFLLALGPLRPGTNVYRVWIAALLLGGAVLMLAMLRNLLLLGPVNYTNLYYVSYDAAKIIKLSDFFSRFEIIIGMNFVLCGLAKTSVCMLAASKGVAKLFNLQDYKKIAVPVGLLMIIFSIMVYANMKEMFDWFGVYKYYALPFQVILPLTVWITAEIKVRRQKRKRREKAVSAGERSAAVSDPNAAM